MAGAAATVAELKATIDELRSELAETKQALETSTDDLIKERKVLKKTRRQLDKSNSYNNDLLQQIEKLSREIQDFRDRKVNVRQVGVQAIAEEILTGASRLDLFNL